MSDVKDDKNKDKEKTYWRRFAEMSREAKEFVLS